MKKSPYSFALVEHARDLHDNGKGPLAIHREFKREGRIVPRDTIKDWVNFKTRCYQ